MRKLLDTIIMPDVKSIKMPDVKDIKIPNVKDIKVNDMPGTKVDDKKPEEETPVREKNPKSKPVKENYLNLIFKSLDTLAKKHTNIESDIKSIKRYFSQIFSVLSENYKDRKIYEIMVSNLETIVFKFYFKNIRTQKVIEAIRQKLEE